MTAPLPETSAPERATLRSLAQRDGPWELDRETVGVGVLRLSYGPESAVATRSILQSLAAKGLITMGQARVGGRSIATLGFGGQTRETAQVTDLGIAVLRASGDIEVVPGPAELQTTRYGQDVAATSPTLTGRRGQGLMSAQGPADFSGKEPAAALTATATISAQGTVTAAGEVETALTRGPRVIGAEPFDWDGLLQPGVPASAQALARREVSVKELRRVGDSLSNAMPTLTTEIERRCVAEASDAIDLAIDALLLIERPEERELAEEKRQSARWHLEFVDRLVSRVADWGDVAQLIRAALSALG